jgi:hypothetical protein
MRPCLLTLALAACAGIAAAEPPAPSPDAPRMLGKHPAIAARRVLERQGYDYASKFYPHPAWLYLSSEPSHPMSHHPAVLVFQGAQQEHRLALDAADRVVAER